MTTESVCLAVIFVVVGISLVYAYWLAQWVLSKSEGKQAMQEVSTPIREGANAFLYIQYTTIAKFSLVLAAIIFIIYAFLRGQTADEKVAPISMAFVTVVAFLFGAFCSGFSGVMGMWISVRTNVRAAAAAAVSQDLCLKVCFRGGAFTGVLIVAVSLLGVGGVYSLVRLLFSEVAMADVPLILVGYGFGASFVALFAQLGGGIYTKAADVGADIIGKVENDIPEDDPRNPAVIADLVGDNVGDCAGRGADLFESTAAENIGAMILGATVAAEIKGVDPAGYILFPLILRAAGLIATMIAIFFVYAKNSVNYSTQQDASTYLLSKPQEEAKRMEAGNRPAPGEGEEDAMKSLMRGYAVCLVIATLLMVVCCRVLLFSASAPYAWLYFSGCGFVGIMLSWAFVLITDYYTGTDHKPVADIAQSALQGHGTVVITGLAVGMESTGLPAICISVALLTAYWLGKKSGLTTEKGDTEQAGIYGTAVATMGMLVTVGFVLAMDTFGPISDNAGGIAEMSKAGEEIRARTDKLDAVGNTTKALTKGYAVGSAGLATFLLFRAFLDSVAKYVGESEAVSAGANSVKLVNFSVPEVFVSGLIGVTLVFFFSSLALRAVGNAAQTIIVEVRRQFKEHPGILNGTDRADYSKCVGLVTISALKEMVLPGMVAVSVPIITGVVMRGIGAVTDRPHLAAQCLASLLMCGTIGGILVGLFLNNAGGAWDNGKKLIESGAGYPGKGTEAHKCSITGDTVGDPCKDTAGPSLHVLVKLLSTVTLVLYPLFIAK